MMWFLVLQGLAIAALGVWGIVQAGLPIGGGLAIVGFGLAWAAIAVFAIRLQNKYAALREALAAADPDANRQSQKQKRLSWLQWGLFAATLVWIAATAPLVGPNELWSIYGAGALLGAMLVVMLYRAFITANLDAAASNRLIASLGGVSRRRLLGKSGHGALVVLGVIAVFAGVIADEYGNLPFKFMSLLWYGLGLTIVWAVGSLIWHSIRQRLPKRQE